MDDLISMDRRKSFSNLIDKLAAIIEDTKSPGAYHRNMLEILGREVVPTVVETVDGYKKGNEATTRGTDVRALESDLQELMKLTGVREMNVKPGQPYDPDAHELVPDQDPSLVTDRNQRITEVTFRGLFLPGGRTIKARVRIQERY